MNDNHIADEREQGDKATCGACNGTGRMVRDPDIGTDQECFACDGSGVFDDAPRADADTAGRTFDRWWIEEGHIAVAKAADKEGWCGAARVGYAAGASNERADAEKDAEPARKKLCTGSHVTCEGREYCLGYPSCDDLRGLLAAKEKKS